MPVNSFDDYPISWTTIDKNARSVCRALAERREKDVARGALLPGTKLPPQRELADFLDINVSTVPKAFRACEQKGLLSARIGSGSFVSCDALSSTRLLTDETPGHIIEMGATMFCSRTAGRTPSRPFWPDSFGPGTKSAWRRTSIPTA